MNSLLPRLPERIRSLVPFFIAVLLLSFWQIGVKAQDYNISTTGGMIVLTALTETQDLSNLNIPLAGINFIGFNTGAGNDRVAFRVGQKEIGSV